MEKNMQKNTYTLLRVLCHVFYCSRCIRAY